MKRFWIYGTQSCSFCKKAVELVKTKGHIPIYIDLTDRPEWRRDDWSTVPQVYDEGRYVGGYAELEQELS